MSSMLKSILAVIVAVVTWFVGATIGNWILRAALPGYSALEASMNFTLTMMIARLVLGLVSSLCAGFVCATIAAPRRMAPKPAAVLMVLLFLPGPLYALDQISDLVPPFLFDFACSGDLDWIGAGIPAAQPVVAVEDISCRN
jgi:hypothetical protein